LAEDEAVEEVAEEVEEAEEEDLGATKDHLQKLLNVVRCYTTANQNWCVDGP